LANFKLTISDKKGRSLTKELKEKDANPFVGLNIGNEIDAALVGLSGKMKITGGSDELRARKYQEYADELYGKGTT